MSLINRHPKFDKFNFAGNNKNGKRIKISHNFKSGSSSDCNESSKSNKSEDCSEIKSSDNLCNSLNSECCNESEDCSMPECGPESCYKDECCEIIKVEDEYAKSLDFNYCKPNMKKCKTPEKVPSFEVCFGEFPEIAPMKLKFKKCRKICKKPPEIHIPSCKCVEIPEIKFVIREKIIRPCRWKKDGEREESGNNCKDCKCGPDCKCDSENRCNLNCKC